MMAWHQRVRAAEASAERELDAVPDWLWDRSEPPVPVEAIADSHYGLLVGDHADLRELAGAGAGAPLSGVLLPGMREIWVNAAEAARAPGRRRFTIGHELGHWVMHCRLGEVAEHATVHCRATQVREQAGAEVTPDGEPGGPRVVDDSGYPPEELDANQFAAALLMPRALVLAEHRRLGGDERRLCEALGVSLEALRRRLWFLTATG
jgi:hypothetical protein